MKEKESISEILLFMMVGIPLSILLSLYGSYAIVKFISWFDIPLILNIKQVYGISCITSVLFYSLSKVGKTMAESVSVIIAGFFVITFLLLINWITVSIFF